MTAEPATRWSGGRLVLRAAAGLALGYILLPLVLISWLAFFRNPVVSFPPEGYTLRWFRAILDQRNFVDGFVMSLQVGVFAMLAGLAIGVPASLALARHGFRGREAFNTLLLLPLVVPGIVAGTAIYVFQVEAEILTTLPLVASLPASSSRTSSSRSRGPSASSPPASRDWTAPSRRPRSPLGRPRGSRSAASRSP